jgi:hypothetical protein
MTSITSLPSTNGSPGSSSDVLVDDLTPSVHRSGVVGVRAGGTISKFPPLFSLDSKVIFHCVASHVRIISVATGELLGVLRGHTARVSKCVAHPTNKFHVILTHLSTTHMCIMSLICVSYLYRYGPVHMMAPCDYGIGMNSANYESSMCDTQSYIW